MSCGLFDRNHLQSCGTCVLCKQTRTDFEYFSCYKQTAVTAIRRCLRQRPFRRLFAQIIRSNCQQTDRQLLAAGAGFCLECRSSGLSVLLKPESNVDRQDAEMQHLGYVHTMPARVPLLPLSLISDPLAIWPCIGLEFNALLLACNLHHA